MFEAAVQLRRDLLMFEAAVQLRRHLLIFEATVLLRQHLLITEATIQLRRHLLVTEASFICHISRGTLNQSTFVIDLATIYTGINVPNF